MEKKSSPKVVFGLLLFCLWLYVPVDFGGGGDVTSKVMEGLGFHDFKDIDRLFLTTFIVLYCVVFTYIADMLLGQISFGLFVIYPSSIGAIAGALYYYSHDFGKFSTANTGLICLLVLLPPFAAMMALALIRKISTGVANLGMTSGRTSMKIPTARELGEKGPTTDRLSAATRTRR